MIGAARVEPSLASPSVDEWAAAVKASPDTASSTHRAADTRSRSATPWLLAIGGAAAFAMLMTFHQVVESSVRDAPLKRAKAERVIACNGADTTAAGTVCTEVASGVPAASGRRTAGATYAQLAR